MKRAIIIGAALAAFMCLPAAAQDNNAVSGSASAANNTANQVTASGAIAAGGNVTFNEAAPPSRVTTRQDGTAKARIASAPSLGGLALGGGHPCAYSPATAQISIIGGGFGAGGMDIDEACMLMVMGAAGDGKAYKAATYMLAGRDREACAAMFKAGMVDDCVNKRGKSYVKAEPTISSRSAPTARTVSLDVECRRVGNKVTPVTSRAVMDAYGAAAVKAACQ